MAVTEEERHALHVWFEEHAGPEIAATLMKHLPPVGWMDVTTNTELEHVRSTLSARIDRFEEQTGARLDRLELALKAELAGLRADFERSLRENTRTILLTIITALVAVSLLLAR